MVLGWGGGLHFVTGQVGVGGGGRGVEEVVGGVCGVVVRIIVIVVIIIIVLRTNNTRNRMWCSVGRIVLHECKVFLVVMCDGGINMGEERVVSAGVVIIIVIMIIIIIILVGDGCGCC